MTSGVRLMLALGVLALGGVVAGELAIATDLPGPAAAAPPSASAPPRSPPSSLADGKSEHAAAVAGILARPLFAPARRPPIMQAAAVRPAAAAGTPLPRLSGIVITGAERRAIFALPGAARPLTAPAGGQIGAFTVQTIERDRVLLQGPDGPQELRLSYASSPSAATDTGLSQHDAFLGAPSPSAIANASPAFPIPVTGPDAGEPVADTPMPRFTRGSAARLASNRPEPSR